MGKMRVFGGFWRKFLETIKNFRRSFYRSRGGWERGQGTAKKKTRNKKQKGGISVRGFVTIWAYTRFASTDSKYARRQA
jgi:hypothetical protein